MPDRGWRRGAVLAEPRARGTIGGSFQDLVIRNNLVFALDASGCVTAPTPQFELPTGIYTQISASTHELCGLRAQSGSSRAHSGALQSGGSRILRQHVR